MHVRWRGLELPARVTLDEQSATDTFGRFTIEPFERGFGTTIGNSVRRVLLSSIEGAAVTAIRVQGADHEFCTLPGVVQDMVDIVLNIKGLVVSMEGDEPKLLRLSASGPGEVTADLIETDSSVTIHNGDHIIATLTDAVDFEMELTIDQGRGYVPAAEHFASRDEQVIGEIPVDAVYSPVLRVRYRVESTRVGQKTNYDRLVLDIWTKQGTVTPDMCLVEAGKILRKHLNAFVQYGSIGSELVSEEAAQAASVDEELISKLNMPVSDLDLTVRSSNCLEAANITTVGQLASLDERGLLGLRSFGRTSLREVKRKLEDIGLTLGIQLPEGVMAAAPAPYLELGEGDTEAFSSDDLDAPIVESEGDTIGAEPPAIEDAGDEIIGAEEQVD